MSDSVRPHRWEPNRLPYPGILQARTLEWVAICFSNAWKWKVKVKSLSRAGLLATPWTAVHQAPPSMGFDSLGKSTGVACHCLLQLLKPSLKDFKHYLGSMWNEHNCTVVWTFLGFPCGSAGKESAFNTGDLGLIPGLGISPGEGKATHSSIRAWRIPWTV